MGQCNVQLLAVKGVRDHGPDVTEAEDQRLGFQTKHVQWPRMGVESTCTGGGLAQCNVHLLPFKNVRIRGPDMIEADLETTASDEACAMALNGAEGYLHGAWGGPVQCAAAAISACACPRPRHR